MFDFKNWIFNQFPGHFKRVDTYKDVHGEGLFQRYTTVFDHELAEEIYPFIGGLYDLLSAENIPLNLTSHLALNLGRMPQTGIEQYDRRLLRWANRLFQVKGTVLSYKMIAQILGLELISISQDTDNDKRIIYDQEPEDVLYDGDDEPQYDTECAKCIEYDLTIDFKNTDYNELLPILKNLICFIEPIDAKLRHITLPNGFQILSERSSLIPTDPNYEPLEEEGGNESLNTEL